MKTSYKICSLLLFMVMVSCKKDLNRTDYYQYVRDEKNGLRKIIDVNEWQYAVQYRPYDYITLTENDTAENVYTERMEQLKGTAWFNISFKIRNGNNSPLRYKLSSLGEYQQRYNYFTTQASRNICMIYGTDTLTPMSYVFETSYNLAPEETMVVGFRLPAGDSLPVRSMQLSYNDVVFNNGIIKASFSKNVLTSIPNLKN